MSNYDSDLVTCDPRPNVAPQGPSALRVQVLGAREVPLGGPRAMPVRRTLPQRERSFIGAWCFADHYGPVPVGARKPGMDVAPHPHTGLQTVSWLFEGEIEHRDSTGVTAIIRPGEVNLMTAGRGISHSEVSTPDTTVLHGAQLWVVLPESASAMAPGFENFVPESFTAHGVTAAVFIGDFLGASSPVTVHTPLLGAELIIPAGARVSLPIDPTFEHGVLLDTSSLIVAGAPLARAEIAYLAEGATALPIENPTDSPARVLVLGGAPFAESVIMWWNFIGRTHDEVAGYRREWQERGERFGTVSGYLPQRPGAPEWLPAPALPGGTLTPRSRTAPPLV